MIVRDCDTEEKHKALVEAMTRMEGERRQWEEACQRVHGRSVRDGEYQQWHDRWTDGWNKLSPKQQKEIERLDSARTPEERQQCRQKFFDRIVGSK